MSATENLATPLEIDTKLAELHTEAANLDQWVASAAMGIYHTAGARRQYQWNGRSKVASFDMTFDEATTKLSLLTTNHDEAGYRIREAAEALAKFDAVQAAFEGKQAEIREVQKLYTGWSRFFLVTSSTGHIHSSMHCSTCRMTTTFGWLPQLSGKTEADAVETCGPALCSVCFPSAPLDHQAQKLTKTQVKAILAGETVTQKPKQAVCAGSGRYLNRDLPHRTGYYSGNWATCEVCHEHASVTSTGKVRSHKPKAA